MEQDKDLAFLAGGSGNRHSTKRNPGPKLHVEGRPGEETEGLQEAEEDYYLEEVPTSAGKRTDSRLDREARAAARIGIPVNEGAHLPSTLAGSLASRSQSEGQETAQSGGGALSPLALPAFKAKVEDLLREFFLEQDYDEARLAFNELMASAPFFAFEFVARTIRRALEKTDADREAACRLLSTLSRRPAGIHTPAFGAAAAPPASPPGLSLSSARTPPASPPPAHVLSQAAVGQGVERVLEMLDDVVKDVPRARGLMARLVARAVADEILPPGFLDAPTTRARAPDVVTDAAALLSAPHACERLEHAWGTTAADSVEEMKGAVKAAIREYLHESGDVRGPIEALRGLASPFFSWYAVYELLRGATDVMGSLPVRTPLADADAPPVEGPGHAAAVEAHDAAVAAQVVTLLLALKVRGLVSDYQAAKGAARAEEALADIATDDPRAREHLGLLLSQAVLSAAIPDATHSGLLLSLAVERGTAPPGACPHCAAMALLGEGAPLTAHP